MRRDPALELYRVFGILAEPYLNLSTKEVIWKNREKSHDTTLMTKKPEPAGQCINTLATSYQQTPDADGHLFSWFC